MRQKKVNEFIQKNCLVSGNFILRSGQVSSYYFDKYKLFANPEMFKQATILMQQSINRKLKYDVIAGLEVGGVPIATLLSQLTEKPLCIVRKQAKEHGTKQLAEGADIKGKRVLVIEDVISTAGQVISSTNDLKDAGAIPVGVSCLILRSNNGLENINSSLNIPLFNVFTYFQGEIVKFNKQAFEQYISPDQAAT